MRVLLLLVVSLTLVSSQKCRALVLSGGGSYGSYESGALTGLVNSLPPSETAYNTIVGISAGSINTLGLSMFPEGQESQGAQYIETLWLNLNGSQNVIQQWPGGLLAGLTVKSGIYDTTPLNNYLSKSAQLPPARSTLIGATSLNTGDYVVFDSDRTIQEMVQVVMASSAIEAVFPPIKIGNDVFTDGGVTMNSDPMSAIEECLSFGFNEADVIVDMVSCYNNGISVETKGMTTMGVLSRAKEIRSFTGDLRYIAWATSAYPQADFRYYIQPSEALPLTSPLDFSTTGIQGSINIGVKDAAYAVQNNIFMKQVLPSLVDTIYI